MTYHPSLSPLIHASVGFAETPHGSVLLCASPEGLLLCGYVHQADELLARLDRGGVVIHDGPEPAPIHVLPQLWFRNTWSWTDPIGAVPEIRAMETEPGAVMMRASHPSDFGAYHLYALGDPELLFTHNDTNSERLFGGRSRTPYVKDAFHDAVIRGDRSRCNPERRGTKAASWHRLVLPPGGRERILLRLSPEPVIEPFAGSDELLELALDWDCVVSIDTDAHAPGQMEWQISGCDKAVRHGIDDAKIVNTMSADDLLAWAAN